MKKILAGLSVLGYLLFVPVAYAASAALSLSPATGTFNQGCSFSLNIMVDTGGVNTIGTDSILFYDPTRFTAQAIRKGTIYSEYPGNSIDAQNGKVTVSGLASTTSAFNGSGILATIDFAVLTGAPAGASQMTFDFAQGSTTDSNIVEKGTINDILSKITNGNFAVGTGVCGTTPTPTPTGSRGGPITATGSGGRGTVAPTLGGQGGIVPTTAPLANSGDLNTTLIIGGAAGMLIMFGILGLALL